jgi:hypothetical protein
MSPTAWRRVVKGKWWAHEDSNLGQTDYEAVELDNSLRRKPKTRIEFSFSELSILTETELIPNLVAGVGSTELGKWQNSERFRGPNTELIPSWNLTIRCYARLSFTWRHTLIMAQ